MKRSLATVSLVVFGLSIVFLILWTVFESAFVSMSTVAERIVTLALLVLPPGIGAVFGLMGLIYKDGQRWLAFTGMILNLLFALFHLMIVVFAG